MKRVVEVRAYNLVPGTREEFHNLVLTRALPMLERWNVDVVAFGPSPHDDDSYYLMRAYQDLRDHKQSQDAFYDSDEWRLGPRESIIALIASHTSFVIELDEDVIDGLRR